MKQVRQRTALIILLIALLAAGMALFCIFYFVHGADWASFSANAHAYTDGTLTSGEILDREGVTLYDPATGEYADSRSLRRATLHAVGDPQNNISTGAKTAFRSRLVGFNPLTGTTTGGHKLYLSIDSSLNETARDLLNGRKGSVAVYNYQTGQILCMVSSPDFDPADPPTITDGDSRYDGEGAMEAGVAFVPLTYGFGFAEEGSMEGLDCAAVAREPEDVYRFIRTQFEGE